MRFSILAALAVAVIAITSCSDAQIARTAEMVKATDEQLDRANLAVATAEKAVATAKQIAAELGNEQALRVVAQADAALDQVKSARDIAATVDTAAHSSLNAAKQSQEAGGSSVAVIGAAATGAIPGILAALAAGAKWLQALRSFRQTVAGLDDAKAALAADPGTATAWGAKIAPALDAAQDEKTKQHVALVRAA